MSNNCFVRVWFVVDHNIIFGPVWHYEYFYVVRLWFTLALNTCTCIWCWLCGSFLVQTGTEYLGCGWTAVSAVLLAELLWGDRRSGVGGRQCRQTTAERLPCWTAQPLGAGGVCGLCCIHSQLYKLLFKILDTAGTVSLLQRCLKIYLLSLKPCRSMYPHRSSLHFGRCLRSPTVYTM